MPNLNAVSQFSEICDKIEVYLKDSGWTKGENRLWSYEVYQNYPMMDAFITQQRSEFSV